MKNIETDSYKMIKRDFSKTFFNLPMSAVNYNRIHSKFIIYRLSDYIQSLEVHLLRGFIALENL